MRDRQDVVFLQYSADVIFYNENMKNGRGWVREVAYEINWLERQELPPKLPLVTLGAPAEAGAGACCTVARDGEAWLTVCLNYEHSIFTRAECLGDYVFFGFANDLYVLNLLDTSVQHIPLRGYFNEFYSCEDRMLAASACDLTCFDLDGKLVWESFDLGLDGVVVHDCDGRHIRVSGEWDPPGGWVDAVLDAQTGEKVPGFYIGDGYYCRIVPGLHHPDDFTDLVRDIHYEPDIWLWTAEKGMHRPVNPDPTEEELAEFDGVSVVHSLQEAIDREFGQAASKPSWLLAKLWHMTGGAILQAMANVDENGKGFGDGGDYQFQVLIESAEGGLAVLEGRGDQSLNYIALSLAVRSEHMKAAQMEQLFRCLQAALLADVRQLAVCRIVVEDPEKGGFLFEYGWDGKQLLGNRSEL